MEKLGIVLYGDPEDGGAFQYQLTLINVIKVYFINKYDIEVFSPSLKWIRWCRENKIPCTRVELPNIESMKFLYKMGTHIPCIIKVYNSYFTEFGIVVRKKKIDTLLFTGEICAAVYGTKTISHVFDLMHRYECQFPEVQVNYSYRELLYNGMRATADVIIADSRTGCHQFWESYSKGHISCPKLVSLPFIATMKSVKEVIADHGAVVDIPPKFLFYPAQFWKHKNHINLVKAVELLSHELEDIYLILVGSEKNNKKQIDKYIKHVDLEKHIKILGFVSDEMMVYLYKHATAMIMPSYFGPTNIPPLEAMLYGCPVAVSNKYAMPEQVGNAGLTFDPDSPEEIAGCIRRLWTDEELRIDMIEKGKRRIASYGEREFANRLEKIIRSVSR